MAKPSNNRHRMDIHALRYLKFNKVSITKKGECESHIYCLAEFGKPNIIYENIDIFH